MKKKIPFFSALSCLCFSLLCHPGFAARKGAALIPDQTLLGYSVTQSRHSSVLIDALKKNRTKLQCDHCEVPGLSKTTFQTGEGFLEHVVHTVQYAPSVATRSRHLRGYMCAKCGKVFLGNNALGISGHNTRIVGSQHDTPAQFISFHVQQDVNQLMIKYFDYFVSNDKALVEVVLPLKTSETAGKSMPPPLVIPPRAFTATADEQLRVVDEQLTVVTASSGEGASAAKPRPAGAKRRRASAKSSLNWLDQTKSIPDEHQVAVKTFLSRRIDFQNNKMSSRGSKKIYLLSSQIKELDSSLSASNYKTVQEAYTAWAEANQKTSVNRSYIKNWMSRVRGIVVKDTQPIFEKEVASHSVTNKVMPESLYDFLIERGHMSSISSTKKARR